MEGQPGAQMRSTIAGQRCARSAASRCISCWNVGTKRGYTRRRERGDLVDEYRRGERAIRSALRAQAFADDAAAVAVANAHARRPIVRRLAAAAHTASTRTRSRSLAIVGSASVALMNASAPPLPVASTAPTACGSENFAPSVVVGRGLASGNASGCVSTAISSMSSSVAPVGALFAHRQQRFDRRVQVLAARVDLHVAVEDRPHSLPRPAVRRSGCAVPPWTVEYTSKKPRVDAADAAFRPFDAHRSRPRADARATRCGSARRTRDDRAATRWSASRRR